MYLGSYLTFRIGDHIRFTCPIKTISGYIQRKIFGRDHSKFKSHSHSDSPFMCHLQNIPHQGLSFFIMFPRRMWCYRTIIAKSFCTNRQLKYLSRIKSKVFHSHRKISPTGCHRIIKTSLRKNIFIFYFYHRFHIGGIAFSTTSIIMKTNKIDTILPAFIQINPVIRQIPGSRSR